jgi:uncharacterized protein (UPF0335 family)
VTVAKSETPGDNKPRAEILKSLVERIERINVERKELSTDVSDTYKEGKAHGIDPRALKAVIRRREKMAEDPEAVRDHESLVEMYEEVLG